MGALRRTQEGAPGCDPSREHLTARLGYSWQPSWLHCWEKVQGLSSGGDRCAERGLSMPPDGSVGSAPGGAFYSNRCVGCGGRLDATRRERRPRPEDHLRPCASFELAVRIMQYVKDLESVMPRAGQRDLRKHIKDLAAVACTDDPDWELRSLYLRLEEDSGDEPDPEQAVTAEMLGEACRALAEGRDPRLFFPPQTGRGPGQPPGA